MSSLFSEYTYLNRWNPLVFGAKFLVAGYWEYSLPNAQYALILAGILQILLSTIGLWVFFQRWRKRRQQITPATSAGVTVVAAAAASSMTSSSAAGTSAVNPAAVGGTDIGQRGGLFVIPFSWNDVRMLYIPMLTFFWQFWLGFLLVTLPGTWFSGTTLGFILLHTIAETGAFMFRWALMRGSTCISQSLLCVVIYFTLATMLDHTTSNPYIRGLLATPSTFLADFGNLVWVPYVWLYRQAKTSAERQLEVCAFLLSLVHVLLFWGQGLVSCLGSVEAGGYYMIALGMTTVVIIVFYLYAFIKAEPEVAIDRRV